MIVDDFRVSDATCGQAGPIVPSDQFTFSLNPVGPTKITINAPDGRSAIVGFDGSEVAFSGDLPVGEAARLFFECSGTYRKANDDGTSVPKMGSHQRPEMARRS